MWSRRSGAASSASRRNSAAFRLVFRQPPRYETPVLVSILVLAGLLAVSISVLERRVRGVEIVK